MKKREQKMHSNVVEGTQKKNQETDDRYNFWHGDVFHGARTALYFAGGLLLASLIVTVPIAIFVPQLEIGTSVVRDINILMISTLATLLGLYVTAFIFLNESLKNREKDDPTIKEAVNLILDRYRINMIWIAISTVATIVLEVVCNIFLGQPQGNISIEDLRLSLHSWVWFLFIFTTVCAVFILAWIIIASRDITNSDRLIAAQSVRNLKYHQDKLINAFDEIEPKGKALIEQKDKESPTDFGSMTGELIFKKFVDDEHKYKREMAYASISERLEDIDDLKDFRDKFILELGKVIRFIEQIISRICDNNIDKSVMNREYVYQSMRSGFNYLYARDKKESILDVRDQYRFFDHLKYQIITDIRFKKKPFDNDEVEKSFERAKKFFMTLHFSKDSDYKKKYIEEYQKTMRTLIDQFFKEYESLIGYRDAMIHYDRYRRSQKKHNAEMESVEDVNNQKKILKFAEIYKRILLDRFTSFVKLNDLNLGNSTMDKSWFNYSELSDGNFTHSSFKFARLENAILRNCDLSTCNFILADASGSDFTESNFSYSDMTGLDLTDAILNKAQMNAVIFRDERIDTYYEGIRCLLSDNGASLQAVTNSQVWHTDFKQRMSIEMSTETQKERLIAESYENLRNGNVIQENILRYINGNDAADQQDDLYISCRLDENSSFDFSINDETTGCVLNSSYRIISDRLRDFFDYRKYCRVDPQLYEQIATAREKEEKRDQNERENKYGKIYFGIAKLHAASVNEVSMQGIDFSHVHIDLASFHDSDLSNCAMYYTFSQSAMFHMTNLNGLDAYEADFSGSNFEKASLVGALLTNCNFTNCNFKRAIMLNTIIINEFVDRPYMARFLTRTPRHSQLQSELERAEDEESYEDGTRRIEQIDKGHNFKECEFKEILANNVIIINVNMMRSRFERASMRSGLFYNVLLRWCDFRGADFANSIFIGTSFHQSNLEDALLSRSRFYACDFSNASLKKTNLISTRIEKVIFDEANLNGCNFSSANVIGCTFSNCNLTGAIFDNNTQFKHCVFCGIDFEKIIGLSEAQFIECVFESGDNDTMANSEELQLSNQVFLYRVNSDENISKSSNRVFYSS